MNVSRKVKNKDCFEDNSCPMQNPSQPVPAQWEGDNAQLNTGITFFVHETGNYFERMQFSPNSEGYAEGSTEPILRILQEYVVIFCIVRPNPNSV